MHLFAKHSGTIKRFDKVDDWSFDHLHKEVKKAFNIIGDFVLYIGDSELSSDSKKHISNSDVVSGDRIRIVLINSKNAGEAPHSHDCELKPSVIQSQARPDVMNKSSKELIIEIMKEAGYEMSSERGSLMQFKQPDTSKLAEIGLLEYDDDHFSIQTNMVDPPFRVPVASTFFTRNSKTFVADLKKKLIEQITSIIFGSGNHLLRLLYFEELAEKLFILLPAISVLRLECISKDAMRICHERRMERVWMLLLRRDFGGAKPNPVESYRDCYRRKYLERRHAVVESESLLCLRRNNFIRPVDPDPDFPEGPFRIFPRSRSPSRPFMPDPDFPLGPLANDPDNPFGSFGPRFPVMNPRSDPFGNSEIVPSRPLRPQGRPREFPRGSGANPHWFG